MKPLTCMVVWIGAVLVPAPAYAATSGVGLEEIPEAELGEMRGRYTVAGNTVAWFGVTMVSRWQTGAGQLIQGQMQLGLDFRKGTTPTVSFTPSITLADADAPAMASMATTSAPAAELTAEPTRSVDSSGLANVSGLAQSVQVAGDGNQAWNRTSLRLRDDGEMAAEGGPWQPDISGQQGNASARVSFDGRAASVQLQVEGLGTVQQWIRSGSVGQSIALTGDGQRVQNQLQVELVRQAMTANTPLGQNVAQAVALARGLGPGL